MTNTILVAVDFVNRYWDQRWVGPGQINMNKFLPRGSLCNELWLILVITVGHESRWNGLEKTRNGRQAMICADTPA